MKGKARIRTSVKFTGENGERRAQPWDGGGNLKEIKGT